MKLWMFGVPDKNKLSYLKNKGFDNLVIDYKPELIKEAKEQGLSVYIVLGTFKVPDKNKYDLLAEDAFGRRQMWFKSGCPNNPEIRKKTIELIREIIKYDIDGIILDGIRFSSPGSGLGAFFTCFCKNCIEKAKEFGIDLIKVRENIRKVLEYLYNIDEVIKIWEVSPSSILYEIYANNLNLLNSWLKFREMSIVEFVREIRNLVKSYNIKLGAYVFTPSLAFLVGQNYNELWKYLDVIKPMIYRIGNGVACLNYEIYALVRELIKYNKLSEEKALSLVYDFFGIKEYAPKTLKELLNNGLKPKIMYREALLAKELIRDKIELSPIIMLNEKSIEESVKMMIKAGINSLDFFAFRKESKPYIEKALRVIDNE